MWRLDPREDVSHYETWDEKLIAARSRRLDRLDSAPAVRVLRVLKAAAGAAVIEIVREGEVNHRFRDGEPLPRRSGAFSRAARAAQRRRPARSPRLLRPNLAHSLPISGRVTAVGRSHPTCSFAGLTPVRLLAPICPNFLFNPPFLVRSPLASNR